MSRDQNAKVQQQEEARKGNYTGLITKTMDAIPSDYTPGQKADITTAEMSGIDVGYGNLKDEIMRRGSATGSSAGIPEALAESTKEGIRAKADAGAQLQEMFANVPVQRALQKASIFQPALGGMLFDRYPAQSGSSIGGIIQGGAAAAGTAALIF